MNGPGPLAGVRGVEYILCGAEANAGKQLILCFIAEKVLGPPKSY
jgi:hypothetical protein